MALSVSGMSSKIIGDLQGITTSETALNTFYRSLCEYCEGCMEIWYTWGATLPAPISTPDPMVLIQCGVKPAQGEIPPSLATTPEAALGSFSASLNSLVSRWEVVWPTDFTLPPAYILPSIVFTASGATNQQDAWNHICQEIIDGITKAATPGPIAGVHGGFTVPAPGATYQKTL